MRQAIRARGTGPVVGNENGVWSNCLDDHGLQYNLAATRGGGYPIAIHDSVVLRQAGMNFKPRSRVLVEQSADAARLPSRKGIG